MGWLQSQDFTAAHLEIGRALLCPTPEQVHCRRVWPQLGTEKLVMALQISTRLGLTGCSQSVCGKTACVQTPTVHSLTFFLMKTSFAQSLCNKCYSHRSKWCICQDLFAAEDQYTFCAVVSIDSGRSVCVCVGWI